MIIRNDHTFLKSAKDIQEIANPLSTFGINYFAYSRNYFDGGRVWLSSMPENLEFYISNKMYHIGNSEAHPGNYKSQVVLWSTLPNQRVYEFIKQKGVHDGIFIVEPYKDGCEFTAFGINKNSHQAINTFLTNKLNREI